MCNRIIQSGEVIKPGQRIRVKLRGPGGEWEQEFDGAVFGGPARTESRHYWMRREHAEEVLIPDIEGFGEKNQSTGAQGWQEVADGSAMAGMLLPQPEGKDYRLLKVLTQPASADQIAKLGNDRAPVFL